MDLTCSFQVDATLVANDFIDRYMAEANGEYVKVYLYILRHRQDRLDLGGIADALNHTEADVKRALLYWEKLGALRMGAAGQIPMSGAAGSRTAAGQMSGAGSRTVAGQIPMPEAAGTLIASGQVLTSEKASPRAAAQISSAETATAHAADGSALVAELSPVRTPAAQTASSRPVYSQDQVNCLQGDADFAQLLYIAQRYLNKIFTPRELEVFAYLYDGLHMSVELLEYLVEHCVQGGHTSIRYIETVALSWHEKGFRTVEEAKAYASGFTKDSFSVMRAFGLTDRKPGDAEKEAIARWFGTYGFTREVVLEACNRTMEATHNPSFRYAEKILSDWKKAGVKNLKDISVLDEKRRSQGKPLARTARKSGNQFHNFEQRNTDYDSMVLDQVKDWLGES